MKNQLYMRGIWFLCLFVQHIKWSRDRLPGAGMVVPRLCVGFSLSFSHPSHVTLGTSGLPPVLYWVSSRKKGKKKGKGHMSAKSSPFKRNLPKAPLNAIMCIISQHSVMSNNKGSISCEFLSEHAVILNRWEPFRLEERKNEYCIGWHHCLTQSTETQTLPHHRVLQTTVWSCLFPCCLCVCWRRKTRKD